ncbi:MAG TPA: hypothetical protein VEM76_05375 [Anaeromyxobacteraceae bacterium]|nr:hypothetical protein [Anaeromyxobacteraceae bacterium]
MPHLAFHLDFAPPPGERQRFAAAERSLGVPQRNVYVVFTEHDGENFHMDDRVLPSWAPGEGPLAGNGEAP